MLPGGQKGPERHRQSDRGRRLQHQQRKQLLTRGTLVFDDGCPLCSAIARSIELRDAEGRIALLPFSEAVVLLVRAGIDRRAAQNDVWFLAPGRSPVRGVAVLAPLARRLPRWRRFAPVLATRPVALLFAGLWILLKQLRHEL